MRRRRLMPTYAPLLGFAYVPLGVGALALGSKHHQAASALFTGAAFAFLWFLGSLHAKIIRYDPGGFFASIVVLGGAALLALQAAALASRDALVAAPGAACAATVIIGSSLAALNARKVVALVRPARHRRAASPCSPSASPRRRPTGRSSARPSGPRRSAS